MRSRDMSRVSRRRALRTGVAGVLLLGAVVAMPGAAAQPAAKPAYETEPWVFLGGPVGGMGYDVRMVPNDPRTMYVTDAHAGAHKSLDQGKTWTPANHGMGTGPNKDEGLIPVFCLTISPHDPKTVWAGFLGSGQVFRTTDGGGSWQDMSNGIHVEGRTVRGITIDPKDPNILYIGVEVHGANWKQEEGDPEPCSKTSQDCVKGEVYKTTDGGQNWKRIWYGDNMARYVLVHPLNTNRIWVSTGLFDREAAYADLKTDPEHPKWAGVGILRSDDAGQTWTVLNDKNGLGALYVPSLFVHPHDPDTLLAAAMRPVNPGTTWRPRFPASRVPGSRAARANLRQPARPRPGPTPGPTNCLPSNDGEGVYVSRDGGDSWQQICATPQGHWIHSVEISVSNPALWIGAGELYFWRSADEGQTWKQMPWNLPGRGAGVSIDLQIDPTNPNVIFNNSYAGGNIASEDMGDSWHDASKGYTGARIFSFAVSPANPAMILTALVRSDDYGETWGSLGMAGGGRSILFQDLGNGSRRVVNPDPEGGIWVSTDDGRTWPAAPTWKVFDLEDPDNDVPEFTLPVVLAAAPSDPQVLYAGIAHHNCHMFGGMEQCFRSVPAMRRFESASNTWVKVKGGFLVPGSQSSTKISVQAIAVHPTDPRTVYAATAQGLHRSSDAGDSWTHVASLSQTVAGSLPPPSDPEIQKILNPPLLFSVLFDPFDARRIFVTSYAGGVYRSDDEGATWSQKGVGQNPYEGTVQIIADRSRRNVFYTASANTGVRFTLDGGETWRSLDRGLRMKQVPFLGLSADGSILYAGTYGNGVYRLGAASKPPATDAGLPAGDGPGPGRDGQPPPPRDGLPAADGAPPRDGAAPAGDGSPKPGSSGGCGCRVGAALAGPVAPLLLGTLLLASLALAGRRGSRRRGGRP